jgi:hypothetical protein
MSVIQGDLEQSSSDDSRPSSGIENAYWNREEIPSLTPLNHSPVIPGKGLNEMERDEGSWVSGGCPQDGLKGKGFESRWYE